MLEPMPTLNLTVAWLSILLQMVAVLRLGKRSLFYPAMLAWSFGSLFVVWFAVQHWNLAWSIGAWVMLPCKVLVVVEACWYVLERMDDRRDAILAAGVFGLCAAFFAMALDTQPTALYSARFIAHATFAGAALACLPFARFAMPEHRYHLAITALYFCGMTLADFNSPRNASGRYWDIHLILAALQVLCWTGWVALFNRQPAPALDQSYPQSAKVS